MWRSRRSALGAGIEPYEEGLFARLIREDMARTSLPSATSFRTPVICISSATSLSLHRDVRNYAVISDSNIKRVLLSPLQGTLPDTLPDTLRTFFVVVFIEAEKGNSSGAPPFHGENPSSNLGREPEAF